MNYFEEYESQVRSYCRKYPVVFSHAKNAELFSATGGRYIDFLSMAGSMNYGHNNPFIKNKIMEYLSEDRLINSLDMYTEAKRDFISTFIDQILKPRNLNYKIMCCGPTGTNGVEAALKLARKNTGRKNVIAFSGAYHGMTLGSLACTTDKFSRKGAGVSLPDVTFVPYDGVPGVDSIKYLEWIIEDDHSGTDKPAAIILETVQAEGGINVSSVEWLKKIREICDKHGIIMIVDDIQVGNGRTGHFFSFERAEIVPDMVVLSKSISGFGLPMSILLMKPDMDLFKPAEHNGTFRGNNLAFVGGAAAVKYYVDNELATMVSEKANKVNQLCSSICEGTQLTYRGIGLIWGIDFSAINDALALECVYRAFEKGLVLEVAGRKDSVLKILPPLTIENELLDEGFDILKDVIYNVVG